MRYILGIFVLFGLGCGPEGGPENLTLRWVKHNSNSGATVDLKVVDFGHYDKDEIGDPASNPEFFSGLPMAPADGWLELGFFSPLDGSSVEKINRAEEKGDELANDDVDSFSGLTGEAAGVRWTAWKTKADGSLEEISSNAVTTLYQSSMEPRVLTAFGVNPQKNSELLPNDNMPPTNSTLMVWLKPGKLKSQTGTPIGISKNKFGKDVLHGEKSISGAVVYKTAPLEPIAVKIRKGEAGKSNRQIIEILFNGSISRASGKIIEMWPGGRTIKVSNYEKIPGDPRTIALTLEPGKLIFNGDYVLELDVANTFDSYGVAAGRQVRNLSFTVNELELKNFEGGDPE